MPSSQRTTSSKASSFFVQKAEHSRRLAICLGFFVALLLLMVISGGITMALLYVRYKNALNTIDEGGGIRNDSAARAASALLLQGLNTAVDPCDDFYAFACGNWTQNNPRPPGHRVYDQLTKLEHSVSDRLYRALRGVDEGAAVESVRVPTAVRTARRLFDSCVRLAKPMRRPSNTFNPLIFLMQNSPIGMWPVLQSGWWTEDSAGLSISSTMGGMAGTYGIPTLVTPRVSVDWSNSSRNVLYLDQATLALGSRQAYLNQDVKQYALKQYEETIIAAARSLAADLNTPVAESVNTDAREIVEFELSVAQIMEPNVELSDRDNKYTIWDLKEQFPAINWDQYFYWLLPNSVYRTVFPFTQVIVTSPKYMKQLNDLLAAAPKRVVYNYLIWRLIYSRLWVLSAQYQDLQRAMKETLDLRWTVPPQRAQCLSLVNHYVGYAAARLFLDAYGGSGVWATNASELQLGRSLIDSMKETVLEVDWMDFASKERALTKLDNLLIHYGYPRWITNDRQLDDYYKDLHINPSDDFFETYNALMKWNGERIAKRLLQRADRSDFLGDSPVVTNAWYSPDRNTLTLPLGLLQKPLVEPNYPAPVLYGGVGSILAHELMHSVDDVGINFGPEGQLGRWLDQNSLKGFRSMAQCLVHEYSQFCYPELSMCVNGNTTLGDNLADTGGLRLAYRAYRTGTTRRDEGQRLAGVLQQFNPDQLFFLSYASVWCGAADSEVNRQFLRLNPHPPDKARVWGAIRSSEEFAVAFNCPIDTPMAPQNRCRIW